ncbi:MAG: alcohol dehydrogenase catalytic domain-containing protein [Spirochaetales bacterium]|nr:alcohol dehydrogenase catalytic domain-containing protein [Spirochaetales bacterium]
MDQTEGKYLGYTNYGAVEDVLLIGKEKKSPQIPPRYVRVEVQSISVNPVDIKILSGEQKYFMSRTFPKAFGTDFFGRVIAVGDKCGRLIQGQWVVGMSNPLLKGSGQRFLDIPEKACVSVPPKALDAVGLPAVGVTVLRSLSKAELEYLCLVAQGRKPSGPGPGFGKKAFVLGANGGVGSIGVQILKLLEYEVHGSASQNHWRALESLGISRLFDRNELPCRSEYSVILDCPGLLQCQQIRSLVLGTQSRYTPVSVPNRNLFQRGWQALSQRPFYSTKLVLAVPSPELIGILADLRAKNLLHTPVAHTFSLKNAQKALKVALAGGYLGKIIITFDEGAPG